MIANVRETLGFEIQRSHDNQNNVSVECEREEVEITRENDREAREW